MRAARVWLLAAVAGLLGGAPQCDTRRTDSLRAVHAGIQRYREGSYTVALKQFRDAVAIDDTNDKAHYYLALVASHQFNDHNNAERHFKKALDLNPGDPEYHYQYGALMVETARYDKALPYLAHTVEKRPEHYQAHFRVGQVSHRQGRLREAVDHYTRTIHLNPRFTRAFVELGNLYLERGHAKEARQVFGNCVANRPGDPECSNELGRALLATGNRAGAIKAFNDALAKRPDYAGALFNVGIAYRDENDARKAVFYLKRYLAHANYRQEPARVTAAEQIVQALETD